MTTMNPLDEQYQNLTTRLYKALLDARILEDRRKQLDLEIDALRNLLAGIDLARKSEPTGS